MLQLPRAGLHSELLGLGVFSFGAPVHHRGPFSSEFAGSPNTEARPQLAVRHAPGTVVVAPADRANEAVSPNLKRAVLGLLASATSGAYAVPLFVTSQQSTLTGTWIWIGGCGAARCKVM